MAIGNLLGSCITNITLILGVSSLLSFSEVNMVAVQSIMFCVLLSSLSVWYMVSSTERLTKVRPFTLSDIRGVHSAASGGFCIYFLDGLQLILIGCSAENLKKRHNF